MDATANDDALRLEQKALESHDENMSALTLRLHKLITKCESSAALTARMLPSKRAVTLVEHDHFNLFIS